VIELVLPFLPTVNHYWRVRQTGDHAGRPKLSDAGQAYRADVAQAVFRQLKLPLPRLAGRLAVAIEVAAPDRRRYDIDNRLKGLLDALAHAGVYLNDEQIDRLSIERAPPCTSGFAKVAIEEIT
jgi:crossover junction endodeoxyribonuclease RusA